MTADDGTAPAGQDSTDDAARTPDGTWLPISAAADRLGLATEALRKRAQRATVLAKKDGEGQWVIFVPDGTAAATSGRPVTRPAGQPLPRPVTEEPGQPPLSGRDVPAGEWTRIILEQQREIAAQGERNARLVDQNQTLSDELRERIEAAAAVQERVRVLEAQLREARVLALGAGPLPSGTAAVPGPPETTAAGAEVSGAGSVPDRPAAATSGAPGRPDDQRPWWRRWLGG